MKAYRLYTLKTHTFGPWKFDVSSDAEKLKLQVRIRQTMQTLKQLEALYSDSEQDKQAYKDAYARCFEVVQRKGYEIHTLK